MIDVNGDWKIRHKRCLKMKTKSILGDDMKLLT